jgi:hypothetical protein
MVKIFGPEKGEEMGDWRRLHIEELNSSPTIIRKIK